MEDSAAEEGNKDAPVLVDIESILLQSKSAHEHKKEVESAPPQFVCSSCPRVFSSKMKRVMHEKLHMQNRGFSSQMKSKLKELTSKDMAVVNASCASSNKNSLLCTECNVYFRTSREKQDHGCNTKNPGLIDTKCITCQKYFRPEDSRIKRCLSCKRSEKTKTKKHQKHKEEIREINGRKVKVIMVNNVDQLDNLNLHSPSKGKDPLSEPTPNLLKKVDVAKTTMKKQKRVRRNSPSKGSNKKSCLEVSTADRPDESNSPALSDPDERPKVRFQCLYCSASFIFPNLLETHCTSNHGRFFFCHFCFLMFVDKDELEIHRMECTRKKIDPKVRDSLNFVFDIARCTCTMCDLTLENHKQLLMHAKSYHSHKFQTETDWILEASASCCGLSFPTRAELVHHKKSEHGALEELPEVVDVPCPKDNIQMEYLTETLTRLKMISFKCPLCPIVNYSDVADKIHQRIVHGAAK
jgi:hypothetical protein